MMMLLWDQRQHLVREQREKRLDCIVPFTETERLTLYRPLSESACSTATHQDSGRLANRFNLRRQTRQRTAQQHDAAVAALPNHAMNVRGRSRGAAALCRM